NLTLFDVGLVPGVGKPWLNLPLSSDVALLKVGPKSKRKWRWPCLRVRVEDLSPRLLKHESIRLEALRRRLEREIDRIEGNKQIISLQSQDAKANHELLALARSIDDLDGRCQASSQHLAIVDQHRRIIESLLQLKRRQATRQAVWDGPLSA